MNELEANNMLAVLRRAGLIGVDDKPNLLPLDGGVSSAIWQVETSQGPVCLKKAQEFLKVDARWQAPLERNQFEARWYEFVRSTAPHACPRLLHHDPQTQSLVMEFLDSGQHTLWKTELLGGTVDQHFSATTGAVLGDIHRTSALSAAIASRFESQRIFHEIRLEPYLLETARQHPDLASQLNNLAERTAGTRKCLIHGDVSPKNIMKGPNGPVFLDAECATYGDPAFDLAFCLNHLLLKRAVLTDQGPALRAAAQALSARYMTRVTWEPRLDLEQRAAALLPALALARIDGKSPVEYIQDEPVRNRIRILTRPLIEHPRHHLMSVFDHWYDDFDR